MDWSIHVQKASLIGDQSLKVVECEAEKNVSDKERGLHINFGRIRLITVKSVTA